MWGRLLALSLVVGMALGIVLADWSGGPLGAVLDEPARLRGMGDGDISALFGKPGFVRRDGRAQDSLVIGSPLARGSTTRRPRAQDRVGYPKPATPKNHIVAAF